MRRAPRILIGVFAAAVGLLVVQPAEPPSVDAPGGSAPQIAASARGTQTREARVGVRSDPPVHRNGSSAPGSVATDRPAAGTADVAAHRTLRTGRPALVADARRVDRAEASSSWPYLHPPVVAAGRLTARIEGHDPIGARALWLWRRGPEGAALLGRTRSDSNGGFDFGERSIPNGDFALVVTRAGGDPWSASPTDATRPDLPPPGFASMIDENAVRIELHPAVQGGELWVMDDTGSVWNRIEVGRSRSMVEILGADLARNHFVVHVLEDGRRSSTAPIHVAATPRGRPLHGP